MKKLRFDWLLRAAILRLNSLDWRHSKPLCPPCGRVEFIESPLAAHNMGLSKAILYPYGWLVSLLYKGLLLDG